MKASGASTDFFDDGLHYLKRAVESLAEDPDQQYETFSEPGLLEETYGEMVSGEFLLRSGRFPSYVRLRLEVLLTLLRRICDAVPDNRSPLPEDFETRDWVELRALSTRMLSLLALSAPVSE